MDRQQEHLAKLRLLAVYGIDWTLDNCLEVMDHSGTVSLSVVFIRMPNDS
jgi:hypothetical protein